MNREKSPVYNDNIIPMWLKDDKISPDRLKILPKNLKHISCSICSFILPFDKSEACINCGEQFCTGCIRQYIQLNEGKCYNQFCERKYKAMILLKSKKEELEEIEMKCRFVKCCFYAKFKDLRSHEVECKSREIQCIGCNSFFEETEYVNHTQSCVESLICCVSCGFKAKLKDVVIHSCELFIYIRNQIRMEYVQEKEKLKNEVRQEVVEEVMPMISKYVNEMLERKNKCENVENVENANEINKEHKEDEVVNLANLANLANLVNINQITPIKYNNNFINHKKRLRPKQKSNPDATQHEALDKSPCHNFFTRLNKNLLPLSLSYPSIKIQDNLTKIRLNESIVCIIKKKLPNKTIFLYGSTKGVIFSYDIHKDATVKSYREHKSRVLCLKECKDNIFLSSSDDKTIKVWDVSKEKSLLTIPQDCYSLCLTYSEDSIISGDSDGTVRMWNSNTGKLTISLPDKHERAVTCLLLANQGDINYLISGGVDCKIKLYNLKTNLCERTWQEHQQPVRSFIPFSKELFISCSEDGNIKMWDLSKDKSFYTLYKFQSGVNDIVALGNSNILCASRKRITIFNTDLKDVTGEKFTKEPVFKIILFEEENKLLCYNLGSTCFYIYSYVNKDG